MYNKSDMTNQPLARTNVYVRDTLEVYNFIQMGDNGFHEITENGLTQFNNYIFDNNIYDNRLLETFPNWTNESINNIYGTEIYTGFDENIFSFGDGKRPALKWVTEDEPEPLTIECFNLNYNIYEYSNLTYNINCETNDLFVNYTFLGDNNVLVPTSILDIEGITYNIVQDIYPLKVCVDSGECVDYNVTISNRITDDINPVCDPLPNKTIYEDTDFNLLINCSDKYTNLTLSFYSFPENISKEINTNSTNFIDNVTFLPPDFDFTLYMIVNDSRGNYIELDNFYSLNEELVTINETFKSDLDNTPVAILFIGFIFFFLILFVLGIMFKIPVFLIFSGIAFLFMGVLIIELLSILGVIIILFGVVILGYALIMIKNN
jgi:hypothetical protein